MAAKATPPVAVVGANIAGLPVPEIIQWVTLFYVIVLAIKGAFDLYDYMRKRFASDPPFGDVTIKTDRRKDYIGRMVFAIKKRFGNAPGE